LKKRNNKEGFKLKDILKKIIQVIGWIVLLGAFASIGFGTENPQLMVPLYFLIFLVLFAVLFIIVRRRKRVVDTRPDKSPLLTKILGAILLLAGILMPYFFFRGIGFSTGMYIILTLVTLILIAIAFIAIRLINKNSFVPGLIGYVILILVCCMPAILMMQHDKSYHALGLAYYAAVIVSILSWTGISTLGKYIKI
jgi:hypothetical protein